MRTTKTDMKMTGFLQLRAQLGAALLALFALTCGDSASPGERLSELEVPFTREAFLDNVKDGQLAVVRLFLEAGMDASSSDPNGVAAIAWAVQEQHPAVVRELLARGAELGSPVGNDGMSILMLAAKQGNPAIVRQLVEGGAPIDEQDDFGNTALLNAAAEGNEDVVEYLLKEGADPNKATRQSKATALGVAAARGHTEIVRALLHHGADVDPREASFDMTPLAVATFKGHTDIVALFIEAGADATARDRSGQTPLDLAAAHDHPEIVALLRKTSGHAGTRDVGSGPTLFAHTSDFAPPLGWVLADPFTDKTPYWPGKSRLRTVRDPAETQRALLRSPNEQQSQAFFILGRRQDWSPKLEEAIEELEKHPLAVELEKITVRTADGIEVSFRAYRMGSGLLERSRSHAAYLLGSANLGDSMLVIDAGGAWDSFQAQTILDVLRALNIERDLQQAT